MTRIAATATFTRIAAAATVAAGLLSAGAAQAMDRDVYIYNDGFDPIYSVYISHVDSGVWGRDLLGRYMIDVGEEFRVEPRNHQGYCRFDIKITYETGEEVYLWNVNICGGRQVVTDEWDARIYSI